MSGVTLSSMHDARDAEDTRLLAAGELSLLVESYYGVIIDRCLVKARGRQDVALEIASAVAERLLRVGEQSGDLGGMCERIAQFHDGALDQAIEVFSKVFEPILMLAVGGLVGLIVALLYMPIFELAGGMG